MKKIILLILFIVIFISGFSQAWINYNTTNGLVRNDVSIVASDKYNNIWVATGEGSLGNGLQKFDGITWSLYDTTNSGIKGEQFRALRCDTNGNVWMSFEDYPGLAKFDGSSWTHYTTTNSAILSDGIWDIQVDNKNNIWLSTYNGVSKFDGTTFTNYLDTNHTWGAMIVEDSSSIWIAEYGLNHFNPITNTWKLYDFSNSNIPSENPSCIGMDKNGLIWLGFSWAFQGNNGGIASFDGTSFTAWPFIDTYDGIYGLTIDDSNNVWVATRCAGLYKFDGSSWNQITAVPVGGCSVCVAIDDKKNIWYDDQYYGLYTNNFELGYNEIRKYCSFSLSPNPATKNLIVSFSQPLSSAATLLLTNVLGQTVSSFTLAKGEIKKEEECKRAGKRGLFCGGAK